MSALDGWIDILRTGTFRDMRGTEATFAETDLDAIAAATPAADPAPVVVGHPDADAPAYAWIEGVRRIGDRLQARLRDVDGTFRSTVEAGRYAGRSVALVADAEGGALRIRHLGFLGGRAPAVPGLAPTQFAGDAGAVQTYEFAADEMQRSVYRAVADLFRAVREWIIERDGAETEVRTPPRQWFLDFVAALPRRVDYRELAGAGSAPAPAERGFEAGAADADARAAREFIRLAAGRGEHVTITEAVDVVRRQREQGGQ